MKYQVDGVEYTSTTTFYKDGTAVDQLVYGTHVERRDETWSLSSKEDAPVIVFKYDNVAGQPVEAAAFYRVTGSRLFIGQDKDAVNQGTTDEYTRQ